MPQTIIDDDHDSTVIYIVEDDCARPEAFLNLSLQYYELGNYRKSIEAAESALQRRTDYALAYNNICAANIKLKEFQKAIAACEKALKLDPDYELAQNNLNWANDAANDGR